MAKGKSQESTLRLWQRGSPSADGHKNTAHRVTHGELEPVLSILPFGFCLLPLAL
jgi:hypothetical protein